MSRRRIFDCAWIFGVSYFVLFSLMVRFPNIYDESFILTGAMRVAAGQVPHRDFYATYGPAIFYIPAALFKLFGESVLASRLLDVFIEALIVSSVYAITSLYCRQAIALTAAMVSLLWLCGFEAEIGASVFPVALLTLVSTAILAPLFATSMSRQRLCFAGAVAGLSALYRYDTGLAILGTHIFVIAVASWRRPAEGVGKPAVFASNLWPYLLGFAILTVPPAIYFFSVSPAYPLLLDVVILPARYYRRARGLPFPGVNFGYLDQLAVYLPVFAVGLSVGFLAINGYQIRRDSSAGIQPSSSELQWRGLLVVFSLLAFVMFFKGFIRVGVVPMFVSILPSLILTAGFLERRKTFPRPARAYITVLAGCFFVLSFLSAEGAYTRQRLARGVPGRIFRKLFFPNRLPQGALADWCRLSNPVTRGFCFSVDDGRMKTIEFISTHTTPDQTILVGLTRHDKVFENDNLIYFATQRMPATKWSEYDAGVQSSREVQTEMVAELDRNAPPYIVLDSEFEKIVEPNDSSKSTGVTMLDDYIHGRYRRVETFDNLTVLQRLP